MKAPGHSMVGEERARLAAKRLGQMVLGKWCLVRVLGVGGMAAVFEAKHVSGSSGAVKILHADLADSPGVCERFMAEGYAANRVAHPGVVTVRAEGTTEDGSVFLLMDLLRGCTLAERLEEGEPFSVRDGLDIANQLLDVLAQAHARGVVHRDIKPDNVFLTEDRRVKLLDFGIAQVGEAGRAGAAAHAPPPGSALGTPAFMPPEQALGLEQHDGRSDLWSLGATLYQVLSGTPVRPHGSATDQLLGAMTRPVPSLGDVAALPRSVIAVVDRALSFDRERRFPDARSMQLAVQAALDELGSSDSRVTLPPTSVAPMALPPRRAGEGSRFDRAAPQEPEPRSALPLYIGLGFAVGISIVVAAQVTLRTSGPNAAGPLPVTLLPPTSSVPSALPAPRPSASAAPALTPSAGARPPASAAPTPARKLPNNSR